MKKIVFVGAIIATLVCSCSNELNEMVDATILTENTSEQMLSFQSEEEFENTLSLLKNMEKQEQIDWVKHRNADFTSLSDVYDCAMNDAEELDESQSSYENFRQKYGDYLFFADYKDDYGVYLPVSNPIISMLINKFGDVLIAGHVRNMKDINSYIQLQRRGGTMYDDEAVHASEAITRSYRFGDAFGYEYDSGWFENNGKKIKLKVGRQYVDCQHPLEGNHLGYRLHFEISFRKKTWLGWTNYSSRVNYDGFYQIGVASPYYISESKDADSSHDYYYGTFYTPFVRLPNNAIGVGVHAIHVELDMHYRGIPDENMPDYNFTLDAFQQSYF